MERFSYAHHRTAGPYTVLQLIEPDDGYRQAATTYARWRRTGVLVEDALPGLHRYELREGTGTNQVSAVGLVAAVAVEPAGRTAAARQIRAHEDTDPLRVASRVARLRAVPVELSPVLGLTRALPSAVWAALQPSPDGPVIAVVDEEGVEHSVGAITDPARIRALVTALADIRVVIADGHHRYAAAAALPARRTMMLLLDALTPILQVLPIHRAVRELPQDALERLAADFTVTAAPGGAGGLAQAVAASGPATFGLLRHGAPGAGPQAHVLRARDPSSLSARLPTDRAPAWRALDAAILAEVVFGLLGVEPATALPRTDPVRALAQMPQGGGMLLLRPVDAATVFAVADAGEAMPAKTTLFRPKPRAGLLLRALP